MSAEQTPLDNPAAEAEEPTVSHALLAWMRDQENPDLSAAGQDSGLNMVKTSEVSADDESRDFDTVAILLRAIQGTEIAARLAAEAKTSDVASYARAIDADSPVVRLPVDGRSTDEVQQENQAEISVTPADGDDAESDVDTASIRASLEESAAGVEARPAAVEENNRVEDGDEETSAALLQAIEGTETASSLTGADEGDDRQIPSELETEPAHEAGPVFELTADDLPSAAGANAECHVEASGSRPLSANVTSKRKVVRDRGSAELSDTARPLAIPVFRSRRQSSSRRRTVLALPMDLELAAVVPLEEATASAEEKNEPESVLEFAPVEDIATPEPATVAAAEDVISAEDEIKPAAAIQALPVFVSSMFPSPQPATAREETRSTAPLLPMFVDSMFPRTEAAVSEQSPAEDAPSLADAIPLYEATLDDSTTKIPTAKGNGAIVGLASKIDAFGERMARAELQLEKWIQGLFKPRDPRRGERVVAPPLIAYHWIVDTPQALKVANISSCGLCLETDYRWSEGNIVSMTLQRTDVAKEDPDSWIAVDFIVVRWCKEGLAGTFIPAAPGKMDAVAGRAENTADKPTLERFVARLSGSALQ